MTSEPITLKTADAAEILGVARTTLRNWAATGAISVRCNPANDCGLFKRSALDKLLTKGTKLIKPT